MRVLLDRPALAQVRELRLAPVRLARELRQEQARVGAAGTHSASSTISIRTNRMIKSSIPPGGCRIRRTVTSR